MIKAKKWFTLVELIIVITILTVLSTIGYISFSWFTLDARNTQRVSHITSLVENMNLGMIQGVPSLNYVVNNNRTLTGTYQNPWYEWPAFHGFIGTEISENMYKAGDINYQLLWRKIEQASDPKTPELYKIGVVNIWSPRFQIAGTLEADPQKAYIGWNYIGRKWISNIVSTVATWAVKVTFESIDDAFQFKVGDQTWLWTGTWRLIIKEIAKDGSYVLLNGVNPWWYQDTFGLASDEVVSLIAKYDNLKYPINPWDGYNDNIPYKIQ